MDEVKYYPARMDYPNLCKPYSNADRIRAMSDEELAEFIVNIKARAAFCKAVGNNEAFEKLCSGEWLRQPAEESDNETVEEQKDGDD